MCLAIPGKVVEFHQNHGVRMSKVDFGGITREACLEYLPDVKLGDYVLVHVGSPSVRWTKRKRREPISSSNRWTSSAK